MAATGSPRPAYSGATERVVAAGYAGKMVAGRYKLETMLGAGAVGEVWLAEHVHMRKRFALKLLDSRIATPEIVARFEREAVAAANVTHPGIAAGTDFGRDEDGSFFLVLEFVQGKSLRALVQQGPVPPKRALGIVRQLLSAIGAAHGKGVVHRDLKPENVMLANTTPARDVVKILDFGIAKIDPATLPQEQLTRAGTIYGTPAYMAPEQAMGESVDQRVDLWAVGIVTFELVSGAVPFPGDGLEALAYIVGEDVPPLSTKAQEVTPELDAFVRALLRRNKDERPADASAAIALLDAAERSYAAPPGSNEPTLVTAAPTISGRTLAIALGGVFLLVGIPLLVLLARGLSSRAESGAPAASVSASSTSHGALPAWLAPSPHDTAAPAASSSATPSPSDSASAAASASAAPSASASSVASAPKPASKPTGKAPASKKDEKGFGKLKSLFK